MRKQKIFIFEFVSGGGYNTTSLPSSLFCEGYSMLKSIIEDFSELDFEIYTLLDKRIAFLGNYLLANKIHLVEGNCNYLEKYKEMLLKSDACYIIAPEFSNILYQLTEIADNFDKKIYSIGLEGIKIGASKMNTYRFFKQSHVPTPETYLIPTLDNGLDLEFIYKKFEDLNHSIIIKPEDGVGAECILHVNKKSQIHELFEKKNTLKDFPRTYILQRYIDGLDLSISLIGIFDENQIKPYILSINTQNVLLHKGSFESQYNGGTTPAEISEVIKENLYFYLQKLNFSFFNGYFGIDFILAHDHSIRFIEINPRLTTSYLGIRNIYDTNPLKPIINPTKIEMEKLLGHQNNLSEYYRLDLKYIGKQTIHSIRDELTSKLLKEIPELITPPISLDKEYSDIFSCFIATKSRDIATSKQRRKKIISHLRNYDFVRLN